MPRRSSRLFDEGGQHEVQRITLRSTDESGIAICPRPVGMLYGYRVHGPYQPERAIASTSQASLDPYARSIDGELDGAMTISATPSATRMRICR
jgi:glycogen operon protein